MVAGCIYFYICFCCFPNCLSLLRINGFYLETLFIIQNNRDIILSIYWPAQGCSLCRCCSCLGSSSGLTHYYYHHLLRPWAFIDVNAVFFPRWPLQPLSVTLSHTYNLSFCWPSPFLLLSLPLCGEKLIDTMSRSIFTPLFSISGWTDPYCWGWAVRV